MESLVRTLALGLAVMFAVYGWCVVIGYGFERGKNLATKHRKVCDVCFRDISKVNAYLAQRQAPTAPESKLQSPPTA